MRNKFESISTRISREFTNRESTRKNNILGKIRVRLSHGHDLDFLKSPRNVKIRKNIYGFCQYLVKVDSVFTANNVLDG